MDNLKNCPLCGAKARRVDMNLQGHSSTRIECSYKYCSASSPSVDIMDWSITPESLWNDEKNRESLIIEKTQREQMVKA